MRRSIMISTLLAASVAIIGACGNNPPEPVKPASTPAPTATAQPSPSPSTSPTGTPAPGKPGTTPEVKKTDDKGMDKDAKPSPSQTAKGK